MFLTFFSFPFQGGIRICSSVEGIDPDRRSPTRSSFRRKSFAEQWYSNFFFIQTFFFLFKLFFYSNSFFRSSGTVFLFQKSDFLLSFLGGDQDLNLAPLGLDRICTSAFDRSAVSSSDWTHFLFVWLATFEHTTSRLS